MGTMKISPTSENPPLASSSSAPPAPSVSVSTPTGSSSGAPRRIISSSDPVVASGWNIYGPELIPGWDTGDTLNLSAVSPPHPDWMMEPPVHPVNFYALTGGLINGITNRSDFLERIHMGPGFTMAVFDNWPETHKHYKKEFIKGRVKITPLKKAQITPPASLIGSAVRNGAFPPLTGSIPPASPVYIASSAPTPNLPLKRKQAAEKAAKSAQAAKSAKAAKKAVQVKRTLEPIPETPVNNLVDKKKYKAASVSSTTISVSSSEESSSSDSDAFESSPVVKAKPYPLSATRPSNPSTSDIFSSMGTASVPFTQSAPGSSSVNAAADSIHEKGTKTGKETETTVKRRYVKVYLDELDPHDETPIAKKARTLAPEAFEEKKARLTSAPPTSSTTNAS